MSTKSGILSNILSMLLCEFLQICFKHFHLALKLWHQMWVSKFFLNSWFYRVPVPTLLLLWNHQFVEILSVEWIARYFQCSGQFVVDFFLTSLRSLFLTLAYPAALLLIFFYCISKGKSKRGLFSGVLCKSQAIFTHSARLGLISQKQCTYKHRSG